MVRLTLPKADFDCDMNVLYEALCEKYFSSAKEFIARHSDAATYFLDVLYEANEDEKYVKIKRYSGLRASNKILKSTVFNDCFKKETLKLKK